MPRTGTAELVDQANDRRTKHLARVMPLYSTDGVLAGYMVKRKDHVVGPFFTEDAAVAQVVRDSFRGGVL